MKEAEINIRRHSGIFTLEARQCINTGLEEAWSFFSHPSNLSLITPSSMEFKITSGEPEEMYEGQIITYRIGILPLIKSNWVTEITRVKRAAYFIDEQRSGPYKIWHHEHHFRETEDGIEMLDRVTYKIPLGIAGRIVHYLFIRKQLINIFTYRKKVIIDYLA
ncbi:MAG: SRPBCC family protein [Bacteroidales bacterium]|nr:SRPBCC family protein [Bacteroidales bacterium]